MNSLSDYMGNRRQEARKQDSNGDRGEERRPLWQIPHPPPSLLSLPPAPHSPAHPPTFPAPGISHEEGNIQVNREASQVVSENSVCTSFVSPAEVNVSIRRGFRHGANMERLCCLDKMIRADDCRRKVCPCLVVPIIILHHNTHALQPLNEATRSLFASDNF